MKILKKGGSREKGGGGNEIHAPCACGQYNNNQGVAFMVTFLLLIEYVYLKTEECQDATLPEQ